MNENPIHEYAKNLAPWAKEMFPQLIQMMAGKPLPEMIDLLSAFQCAASDSCKCFMELGEKPTAEPLSGNKREKADAAIKDLVDFLNKMGIAVSVQEVKLTEKDMMNTFFESLFKRKRPFPFGVPVDERLKS